MRIVLLDDYNQRIPENQGVIEAVTTTWGHSALRNGWKIIEIDDNMEGINVLLTPEERKSIIKRVKIRKLTPRDCMRLMGVNDADFDKMREAGISDTQLYKLAGNSIVVPVLEGIFTQMFRKDSDALF